MALPLQDMATGGGKQAAAEEERALSGHQSSSSSSLAAISSPERPATPPRTQLMDRYSLSYGYGSDAAAAADPERIPAAVFERDDPSESHKEWSMMSTESVFGLQVAPSSDFTGFFLAHPELMDIATPPRTSTVATPPRTSSAAADADAEAKAAAAAAPVVILPPFDSIPELPENTMKGNYSFAFPNLIEDRRNISKKAQPEEQQQQPEAGAATEPAEAEPAPAPAAEAQAQRQASSKPEAAPEPAAGKGGLFSCFPCC